MFNFTQKQVIIISAILHFLAAIFSTGFHHFDEHFQILEFLHLKNGMTTPEKLPWEYSSQVRPWFQVSVYFGIHQLASLLGVKSPFVMVFLFRLFTSFLGFFALLRLLPIIKNYFQDKQKQNIVWMLLNLSWFIPYIQVRTSSESFAISFLLIGLSFYLKDSKGFQEKPPFRHAFFAGLFFGMAYLSRAQVSVMVAFLWFWGVFLGKVPHTRSALSAIGILLMIGYGVFIDHWGYGVWTFSPWNLATANLGDGVFSHIKPKPFYKFIEWSLLKGIPPLSLFYVGATALFWIKCWKNPITWLTLPFFLMHTFITHKELRYIFPVHVLSPLMIGFIWQLYEAKFKELWSKKWFCGIVKFSWGLNLLLLLIVTFRPVNPAVNFYSYVYQNEEIHHIYSVGESPFTMLGLDIEYYKKENFQVTEIKNLDDVDLSESKFVFFSRGHILLEYESDERCEMVYMTYPKWVLGFNYFNWVSRSRVWGLAKCQNP